MKELKEKGITLISLVVTIIILLILVAITMNVLLGENGIVNKAKDGKEKIEIAREKEILQISLSDIRTENQGDLLLDTARIKKAIKDNFKIEDVVVDKYTSSYIVTFSSGRQYEVFPDGRISEEITAEERVEDDDYVYSITYRDDKRGYVVRVKDTTKTSYGPIKNEVKGLPIISLNGTFIDCENMTSIDFGDFDAKNVIDMSYMFYNCKAVTELNLNNFNTENLINMSYMFQGCRKIKKSEYSKF